MSLRLPSFPGPGRRPPAAGIATKSLVAALVAVAVVGLGACGGDDDGDVDDAGPGASVSGVPVLVLGDSLTVGARLWGDLVPTLAADGWGAEVVAEDGRTVEWGLAQARERDTVPPVVVVGLGTNPGTAAEEFPARAAELVAELTARGATTVIWWPPAATDDADRAARADALRAAAGGTLLVPDWPAELAAHPEWVDGDGIHYTDDGYAGLSTFLRTQLAPFATR